MSFQIKIRFLIFVFFSAFIHFGFSQSHNFRNYSTEHGLPQSQVLSIFQDNKGYVWFGTNGGGAGRFDGNKFDKFTANEGLINDVVYSIAQSKNNELLFGTAKGLSVYKNLTFTNFNEKNGLSNSYIYKLATDKNKTWIGTEKGVFVFENNKIIPFTTSDVLNKSAIYSIYIDSQNNIWFGTMQNGIVFYNRQNNSFKSFSTTEGLANNFIFSFAERNNGDMLIGTQTGLNIISKDFKVRAATEIVAQENICFSSIIKNSDDEFYFSTFSEGLFSYNFNTKVRKGYYNSNNGLTNTPILSLLKDRENIIWIGTNGAGIFRYVSDKFVYYSKQNGLAENYINDVKEDHASNIWLALNSNGLVKISDGKLTSYNRDLKNPKGLMDNNINCILPMVDSSIYFGTNEGLYQFKNEKFNRLANPAIHSKFISALYEDSHGKLWISTSPEVFTYHNGTVTEEKEINALIGRDVSTSNYFILEDKFGRIIIGTQNGLIQKDGNKTTLFNQKNKFADVAVICGAIDSRKNIWLGTSDGVYLYSNGTFIKISKKHHLTSGFITFLKIDKNQNLFIGSNNGIDVLNIESFYENEIVFKHFGKDDGLLSLESNANASCVSKTGKILVGTINGLEIYDATEDFINNNESKLSVTDVKLFFGIDNVLDYSNGIDTIDLLPKNLVLPYDKNNLTFKFVGISLVAPEKVKYKYKLEGLDAAWTPDVSKTEITYPSLPPGTYTFMVTSMNNDGLWNKTPATFSFEVLPPWYKTWWFYTLCAITLLAGIFTYNTIKTKKLIADKQKLEKQVDERTKELREEKEKVEVINKEVIQQKGEIEHKNNEILDSIKYAKNIQEALLPSLEETEKALNDCFILYLPKDIVSGDFFWHSEHNNKQFIAAADCTGHGVPGAFMSIVGNNLLHEIINQRDISNPGEILLELHKGVKIALNQNHAENERRDGMDIALCAINKNTNSLEFSGANRPLWIFRKDKGYELEIIKPNKFPIGGLEFEEKREYASHHISFSKGDTLYIFSDGFADQFGGPKGKKFMLSNMQKLLRDNIENPLEVQKEKITEAFKSWKDSLEQIDDVLVIGIKL